jgi:hypothetical protein
MIRFRTTLRPGPKLLTHIVFAKYGLHLPLNRQSDVYQREGIELEVPDVGRLGGGGCATLMPVVEVIRSYVFAAERIHADDTTVPGAGRRARPVSAACGHTCAATARLAVPLHRQRCSIRAIVRPSTPSGIWRILPD